MSTQGSRVAFVSQSLREAIEGGQYSPGDRLPTESQLAKEFEVSRPTVRAALRDLQALALVKTQHGVGTFVQEAQPIHAGLERLDSISESIRRSGHEPGMQYQSRVLRPLMPEEAEKLDLSADSIALEIRRSILSDNQVVAYSYDLMPVGVFPEGEDPMVLQGSLFTYLKEERGLFPDYAVAEIHAVSSDRIAWDTRATNTLYVLLDQVHYSAEDVPLLYSRTYFLEGRYAFRVIRNAGTQEILKSQ
ncbi:GntR family transcriptional regulator [Scrofimicrobium sp. R131]|uniref:GntR family transcriptional regulator n=1 Tax=Scrofimicrobium appendicitidis TaxID=3079930 RepID=A0AAU7V7G8_9ACTO